MGQLTRAIGDFIAGMSFDAIPTNAIGAVKNALSDYTAVTILGRDEPVTRLIAFVRGFAYHDDKAKPIANATATFMFTGQGKLAQATES